jgi:spore maturation protein CgeB
MRMKEAPRSNGAAMRIVVFGLSISSSWGNGHATLWRGLVKALAERGHQVTFFERDVSWYADHRDMHEVAGGELALYASWPDALPRARRALVGADVAIITSFCPDGVRAAELVLQEHRGVKVFYDLDTPVTLERLARDEAMDDLNPAWLRHFDLVLSYTGGPVLDELERRYGARRVAPLYGSVDPAIHRPGEPSSEFAADLSYLGTFAPDRQRALEELFLAPAQARRQARFLIGGAAYPKDFPWQPNVFFVRHLPPIQHASFFASCRLTLNVTRAAMARNGWCPSGRLFEAAACGAALMSDTWDGIETFFTPGEEILLVASADDVLAGLDLEERALARLRAAAMERVLSRHTAARRVRELERLLEEARGPRPADEPAAAAHLAAPASSFAAAHGGGR